MPVYSKNLKTNKNLAILITLLLGVDNLVRLFSPSSNILGAVPYSAQFVPLLASIGLVWVGYGLYREKIR